MNPRGEPAYQQKADPRGIQEKYYFSFEASIQGIKPEIPL